MSSRVSCWLNGHDWVMGTKLYEDLFENTWKYEHCKQCRAKRRVLVESWEARAYRELAEAQAKKETHLRRRYGTIGVPCGRGICALGENHEGPCDY